MNKPLTIGISGGSGAGKTSFIRELKSLFLDAEIAILSQDDYYLPKDQQIKDEEGWFNFDLPSAIDKIAFSEDLKKLINGEVVRKEEYVFNNRPEASKVIITHPAPVIICEGLFINYFEETRCQLDLRIFINAKDHLKILRRIKRDISERNYELEEIQYRYQHHVYPTFEKYIQPYIDDVDLVVNNNDRYYKALEVLSGYIKHYLQNQQS